MDILIIGAGAIGTALGASLAADGHHISLLSTVGTAKAICESGLHLTGLLGDADASPDQVSVYTGYEALPADAFDSVLICTKVMANETVAAGLAGRKDCMRPSCRIFILQNGWGNDGIYLKYFPEGQVFNARVMTGFVRTAPNVSRITVHNNPIMLGSLHGAPASEAAPLAEAISAAGIPTVASDDIEKALWAKMLYNCTLNPLGAVLHSSYGPLADCPETKAIMDSLIDEIYAVMKAAGYSTFWPDADAYREEFYTKLVPNTYAHRSSTLQDIEACRKTEIDPLTGTIIRLGQQYGISVPTHLMLYRQIRFLESQYPDTGKA